MAVRRWVQIRSFNSCDSQAKSLLQRQFVNHVKLVKNIYFCDNAHFFLIYVVLFKWSKQLDTVDLQILLFTEKWTAYEASIIARGNYITHINTIKLWKSLHTSCSNMLLATFTMASQTSITNSIVSRKPLLTVIFWSLWIFHMNQPVFIKFLLVTKRKIN